MDLMDVMRQAQGGNAIANLARTCGAQPAQVEAVMERIVPLLAQRIERNTLSRGGLADTVEIIGHSGYQAVLDQPAAFQNPDVRMAGNDLLEQVLGGKDASRKLAAQAALGSGLSDSIIKMMLPYIVQMVLGGLGRQLSGGLGDILSKIPNLGGGTGSGSGGDGHTTGGGFPQIPQSQPAPQQQSPFPMPQQTFPQQTGGPLGGGGMLPGPEGMGPPQRNPYGDLSDVIRRGGGGATVGGSSLWSVVRSILGSALGFRNSGVIGWIVRMLVMRFGWGILKRVLGRALTGR